MWNTECAFLATFCSLFIRFREELPLLDVHHLLPDDLLHDVLRNIVRRPQHREWGVGVREALDQHPCHLPPLDPGTIKNMKRCPFLKVLKMLPPHPLLSSLLQLNQNFKI